MLLLLCRSPLRLQFEKYLWQINLPGYRKSGQNVPCPEKPHPAVEETLLRNQPGKYRADDFPVRFPGPANVFLPSADNMSPFNSCIICHNHYFCSGNTPDACNHSCCRNIILIYIKCSQSRKF